VCIIGGAKVSDKIKLIYHLIDIADEIIIGGGMAYTFKKVLDNVEIGDSLFDLPGSEIVGDIVKKAEFKDVNIHFPIDHVIADSFSENAKKRIVGDRKGIPKEWMGLDIGPRSIKKFQEIIRNARTVVWNGPMGVFEFDRFSNGTRKIMDAVIEMTDKGGISVVGGGDTATCCKKFNIEHKISHISTGGGASLELLEGNILPGVKFLIK
jgi:phosphoglycerate kinase